MGLFLAAIFASAGQSADSSLFSLENGLNNLIYRLSRSIVTVEAGSRLADAQIFPGRESWRTIVSSGLIIDSSGHILVAAEPVMGQERITVIFDNEQVEARLLGVDYHHALAVIKVGHPIGTPVRMSEKHTCAGQMVIAMGNAYGLRASPSIGFCAGARDDGRLQFSLPLASGALGSGIFDLSGQMIGIMVGSIGRTEQVALAVPAYRIAGTVDYLTTFGDRHAGFLGLTVAEIAIDPPMVTNANAMLSGALPQSTMKVEAGLLVTSLSPDGPSDRAGVNIGDVIFAIGSKQVRSGTELSALVRQLEPEMTINLELIRKEQRLSVPVVVGKRSIPTRPETTSYDTAQFDGQDALADSLSRTLEYFKKEVRRLERRLNGLE